MSIGLVLASGQFAYSTASLLTGHIVDIYTPKRILVVTLLLDAIAYTYLHHSQTLLAFISMNAVIGIMRAGFDNASKTMLVTSVDTTQRGFVFSLRYMVLNVAAALGPIIGVSYAKLNSSSLFLFVAFFYLAIAGMLFLTLSSKSSMGDNTASANKKPSLRITLQLIRNNHALRLLFLISFLCYSVYAQIASTLAQYLDSNFSNGIIIYGNLLMLNAIACVVFQTLFNSLLKRTSHYFIAHLGMLFFGAGFIGFHFADSTMGFLLATLLLSLGEVIFFPLNDILLAKLAPQELTGSYFGIIDASLIGFGIGPIVGGLIYQFSNYHWLFGTCALITFLTIFLYKKLIVNLPNLTSD